MKKILIVDDDELTLELYNLLLEGMAEISYETAGNGSIALDYLDRLPPEQWPDFIFIDLHMPDMSGYEFIEKYQEKFKSGKKESQLYILTSSVSHKDKEKVKEYPLVQGMLSKPLTEEVLDRFIHAPATQTGR